jgi:hypothetical protein
VTSKELHEEITAFVTDRVDEREYRAKVQQNVKSCPDCRASYERELVARLAARDRSGSPGAPSASPAGALDGTASSAAQRASAPGALRAHAGKPNWLDTFHTYYFSSFGIVLALVLVIGCAFLLYSHRPAPGPLNAVHSDAAVKVDGMPSAPENFFNRAAKNFDAMLAGKLGVDSKTEDQAELREYFKSNGVSYPVLFEPVRASLAGGLVSHHGGQSFAHLVYSKGETYLYLFEVPYAALASGNVVYVTPDVLKRLDGGETIWEEPLGSPLAMYRKGDIVIAALSNASRPAMAQMLAVK